MRLPILLTLSLCLVMGLTYAQGPISFHLYLKPGTIYLERSVQKNITTMTYDTSNAALAQSMRQNGMENNTPKEQNTWMEMTTTCGKERGDKSMPIRMEVTKDSVDSGPVALPVGTTFYGKGSPDKMPEFDSLNMSLPDDQKKIILSTIQKTMSQIYLPDQQLSVGQSYNQVQPIDIPFGGMNLKMTITQTYILLGFSADTAGLDMKIKATLDMDGGQLPVALKGGGEGTGHMVYDRKNNYAVRMNTDFIMSLGMEMFQIKVHQVQTRSSVVTK